MGNNDLITDDFVADMLVEEAKGCSAKYSTMGIEAYTSSSSSSSRPANKFKPNTRFLRNIIQGTDRHNKALLAKEQTEAQARLKDLSDAEEAKRRKYRPSAGEIRGRQLGNITALLSGGSGTTAKRKRPAPADDDESDGASSEMREARATEDKRRLDDMAVAAKRARESRDKRRRSVERYSVRRGKEQKDDDDDRCATSKRRNTSLEEDEQEQGGRKRRRRERKRSQSPRSRAQKHHRHRSPLRESSKHMSAHESSERSHRRDSDEQTAKTRRRDEGSDSDPLEDLIGPKPPPNILPRGRGALRGPSGMDSRFSPDYDPKSDVQPGGDARDDWDESLEALRDRAKFRQQGADRLREAGFSEDQIKKWEKGGEKTVDDVQWTKKGEGREWDRGKDVELDYDK